MAAIDAGNDQIIVMADEQAFSNPLGGAYHCWIESDDAAPVELVDLTFEHNHIYAEANGYPWTVRHRRRICGDRLMSYRDPDALGQPACRLWQRQNLGERTAGRRALDASAHCQQHQRLCAADL